MLDLFEIIKDQIKPKSYSICIDNWIFKLHYRATTIIFLIATILVTSRQYIGEHIKCISDMRDSGFERVIESFCFFTTTFTVIDDDSNDLYGYIAHPGVLPYSILSKQTTVRKHMYYQWVPFVLFAQSIMFYLTHLIWKRIEDNRIYKLVAGLNYSRFAFLEQEVEVDSDIIPTRDKKQSCINKIKHIFLNRITLYKSWAKWLIFFEFVNIIHVVGQFYLTDKFLNNQFKYYGQNVITNGSRTLDEVFPKVTKCTFHKYGPSGSIQIHDALCVLALNIINEKIYLFLWFWFIIIFIASCMNLIWRFLTFLFFQKSIFFNQIVFGHWSQGKLHPWHLRMVIEQCSYFEWLLLRYLSKNMDGLTFRELFVNISEDLEEQKPLFMVGKNDKFNDFNKFE